MSAAKHYLGIVLLLAFAASASAAPRAWLDRTQINEGDTVTLNIESESSDTPDFSVLESDFDLRGQSSQTQTTISNGSVTTRTLWAVALEPHRSEEHTSELQSLMRISYAVFCLKKQTHKEHKLVTTNHTTKSDK